MAPTTPAIDRYAVPARHTHPRISDQDAHARARAAQLTALRRKAGQLEADFADTVNRLHSQFTSESQAIVDTLRTKVRSVTAADVAIIRADPDNPSAPLTLTGHDPATVRAAQLATHWIVTRAQRELDEAETDHWDTITALTADVDEALERIARQIRAIDYGVRRDGAA